MLGCSTPPFFNAYKVAGCEGGVKGAGAEVVGVKVRRVGGKREAEMRLWERRRGIMVRREKGMCMLGVTVGRR